MQHSSLPAQVRRLSAGQKTQRRQCGTTRGCADCMEGRGVLHHWGGNQSSLTVVVMTGEVNTTASGLFVSLQVNDFCI